MQPVKETDRRCLIGRTSMLPNCVQGAFTNDHMYFASVALPWPPRPGMNDEAGN